MLFFLPKPCCCSFSEHTAATMLSCFFSDPTAAPLQRPLAALLQRSLAAPHSLKLCSETLLMMLSL
uniref:Secreted protein n=1 Tax=Triticum urartu TaxID=4572 RepID=A0A8R7PTV1_TRIUA